MDKKKISRQNNRTAHYGPNKKASKQK
jgi:hypothetical protein